MNEKTRITEQIRKMTDDEEIKLENVKGLNIRTKDRG
jgi:hypothetical protein